MTVIKRLKSASHLFMAITGLALLAYGTMYLVGRLTSTETQPPPQPNVVVNTSTNKPGEGSIDTTNTDYTVAADMPRLINLPSIQTQGFIQQVSVDKKTSEMAAPNNIHVAGWYINSKKPGDTGLSIIDGHVIGYYQPGIFENLAKLKQHDHFYVEFGNGSHRNFEVVSKNSYTTAVIQDYLFTKTSDIESQLNLITCGGRYNKTTHQYAERVLIVAQRIY